MKHRLFGRVIGGLMCSYILGQSFILPVVAEDEVESPHAAVVKWDFAEWCQIGSHRFTFEKTTLCDIIKTLRGGEMTRDGSSGTAVFQMVRLLQMEPRNRYLLLK